MLVRTVEASGGDLTTFVLPHAIEAAERLLADRIEASLTRPAQPKDTDDDDTP